MCPYQHSTLWSTLSGKFLSISVLCLTSSFLNQSINSSDTSLPPEASPRGGGHSRWIFTSPYPYIPFLPTPTHFPSLPSHSRTPSPNLPTFQAAFPSYLYPQHYPDTPSLQILHFPSFQRNHLRVFFFTHSTTPHPTPLPRLLMPHLSYTLLLLSPSLIPYSLHSWYPTSCSFRVKATEYYCLFIVFPLWTRLLYTTCVHLKMSLECVDGQWGHATNCCLALSHLPSPPPLLLSSHSLSLNLPTLTLNTSCLGDH